MSPQHNPRYWIEKKANRKTGYPAGTIAYYGPNTTFASKVVVGIVVSDKDEVSELRKWFAETTDVPQDLTVTQEILEYLDQHRAQRVVMTDRIIGCPHEEGVDYPEGEPCPRCPYWAHRDRWTGEALA